MTTFFTRIPRSFRPPGQHLLSLLPLLLLLLLPAWSVAQINCFNGFNAGDNTTYCEGETATLNGGYGSYDEVDNNPNLGTPNLVWTIVSGAGTFEFDGVVGASASNINFNNTETGVTGFPDVLFTPDPGETEVVLRLNGLTSAGPCSGVNEVEEVTLYFDPIQDAPIDAFINDGLVLDSGDATTTNSITAEDGDVLDLFIDENFVMDNGQQYNDIRLYTVTYSGPGGFIGLPAAGTYDQNEFEVAFNNLILTNTGCAVGSITLNINAFYDRDPTTVPQPSGPCPGPVTMVEINVNPRPAPQATIGAIDDILIVCEDDADVEVVVTGTPFTQVTYTVSYDGGATVPDGPQTLELDATGTNFDIVLDANDGEPGEDIVVTLIEQEFSSGPPCPVTISKPLTIQVEALPQLSISLADPDDAVICNANNGGPLAVVLVLSTTSGVGLYTFTALEFADGVLVNTNEDLTFFFSDPDDDGIATAEGLLVFEDPVPDGTVMTYTVVGSTITAEGPDPDCVNDAPDASVSILIQKESYVVAEINDSEGGTITLSDYSGSGVDDVVDAEVTFCDEEFFTLDVIDPTTNNAFADIVGSEALLDVVIVDGDGVLNIATSGIYNFVDNKFSVNEALDIPNSQTIPSTFNIFMTPFMDNDGDGLYNDGDATGDCQGNTISVTVNVVPAPTVTVAIEPSTACEGEEVDITITTTEPGTANLILNQGGSPIEVSVTGPEGGPFTGTYSSGLLPAGMSQFTVTTFTGDIADCEATVNQMVMIDAEALPEASVAADIAVCHDEDATITFEGTEGNGTGFTFTYSVNGATPVSVSTDGTDTTVEVTFEPGDLPPGESTISLSSVANKGGLGCVNDAEGSVTIGVEDEPIVSCEADDELICSGDDYSFSLTAGSDEESALGNSLYYSVTTTVTTTVSTGSGSTEVPVESTEIVLGDAGGVTISGTTENMSGFNQTIEISVTPFYFDDEVNDPTEIGDACTGETVTCSVTVKTMPMVTFGGTDAVCEGDVAGVIFTGPPNGRALVEVRDADGNIIFPFVPIFFDDGGTSVVVVSDAPATFEVVLTTVADGPVLGNPDVCINEAEFSFTVNVTPSPEAEFDEEGTTVCEGDNPVIALTGTPFAQVTIDSDNDANDQVVNLDENGEGSFSVTADEDENFTISEISITTEDGNGDDFTCTAEGDDDFELTVNPAPVGALMTNAILCAGEAPQVQFNITNGVAGPFTIFVNGVEFNGVENGDVLDFTGTAFETLEETTTFALQSIVEEGAGLLCSDLFGGTEPSVDVVVNPIPEATAGETPDVICSGDDLQLSVTGTPAQGAEDNDLMFEVTANNAIGDLAAGESIILDAAEAADLNTALGLSGPFINGSTTDNESVSLTVLPFFEGGAGTGGGGDCELTEGFVGDFAEASWTSNSGIYSSVTFTSTTLTLFGAVDSGGGTESQTNASAEYVFTQDGTVSFDMVISLEAGVFGNGSLFDIFIINFEGNIVYNSNTEQEVNASFSQVVTPNSTLLLLLDDDEFFVDVDDSEVVVSNFLFEPTCTRCEGDAVNIDFDILPALFADFSEANPDRVCEGDMPLVCIEGTANATVTVDLGGGVYLDVKLDENGNGCFTPVEGLTEDTDYEITGLTTLDDDPQCSYNYEVGEKVTTIFVTPTPSATVSIDPDMVCAGDDASAIITGTAGATVSYAIGAGDTETITLSGTPGDAAEGTASVPLSTENETLDDVTVTITLSGISVPLEDGSAEVCTATLTGTASLEVRPLPTGVLTSGDPVCFGESVSIFFEPSTALSNNYRLRISDPNGDETNYDITATAGTPTFVFDADIAGTYSLVRIIDGRMEDDVNCRSNGTVEDPLSATTIIINQDPDLKADISGTVGTPPTLDNGTSRDLFRALACDMASINTAFSSATATANSDGSPLMIQIEVTNNENGFANLPVGPSTTVVTLDELNSTDVLDGILANASAGLSNVTVVFTPFFEHDGDDCIGEPITVDITITPTVTFSFDGASDDEVCAGDPVSIILNGPTPATGSVEVTFTSSNIELSDGISSPITLVDGQATITGTAIAAGTASVNVSMVMVTTIDGGISRQCMLMPDATYDILVNPNPEATISVDPAGPICNGESVDIIATVANASDGDEFTFTVDGNDYTKTVDATLSVLLFNSGPLTETTSFNLTAVVNTLTGCVTATDDGALSTATVQVEEVPTQQIVITGSADETVADGGTTTVTLCANDDLTFDISTLSTATPFGGDNAFSVELDDPNGFVPGADAEFVTDETGFDDLFSGLVFGNISSSSMMMVLTVTPFIDQDNDDAGTLEDEECTGDPIVITVVVNPSPKTAMVDKTVCSGDEVGIDFNDGITNGVASTFTFTVEVADDLVRTAGTDVSEDSYLNLTEGSLDAVYTVSVISTEGCPGNDFTYTVTVDPEPVITAEQEYTVCSGDAFGFDVLLDNAGIAGDESFEIISITPSLDDDTFVADGANAGAGDVGGADVLSGLIYTNTGSEDQTVEIVVKATSEAECEGDEETITVIVQPEPVVANTLIKVCSGSIFEIDIVAELTANGVGDLISFERRSLNGSNGTLQAFDRSDDFDTGGNSFAGQYIFGGPNGEVFDFSNFTPVVFNDAVIRDSLVNFVANGPVNIFYDITVSNGYGCDGNTFILQVQVLAPRTATLELDGSSSAICEGMPIQLNTSFDGTGTPTYEYSVMDADDGVDITLTPSASGGEVLVDGTGEGNATIMVMVTDDLGCVAMATRVVSVGSTPEEVVISGFTDPCTGGGNFNFYHIVDPTPESTYEWSLSNPAAGTFTNLPATGSNVSLTFNNSQGNGPFELTVTETSTSGCSNTTALSLLLFGETTADFTSNESTDDPLTYDFTELAGGGIEDYVWDFGDGSATSFDQNPTHTFVQVDPDAQETFTVTLTVYGCSGPATVSKDITTNSTMEQDVIELKRGVNFVSFDVAPADNSVRSVFSNLPDLVRVITIDGSVPSSFQPELPNFRNSLSTVEPGFGYIVIMDEDATMTVTGEPIDDAFLRPTGMGINYVAAIPEGPTPAIDHWAPYTSDNSLVFARTFGNNVFAETGDFTQTFSPGLPPFRQSMTSVYNGLGYMIIRENSSGRLASGHSSEEFEFIHGLVEGTDYSGGESIEILDEAGNVIGQLTTDEQGNFRSTAIFGEVQRDNGEIVGSLQTGEEIAFRYRGQTIKPGLFYSGGFNGSEVKLNFDEATSTDVIDLAVSVMPNPAVERTTIVLQLSADANVAVRAMDATGRVIRELLPQQLLNAGTTNVEWTNMTALPAGMYHVVVLYEGQLLPELTQRVIKQ